MRVVIPKRLSFRGEGLGNEVTPWMKAFLAAESVGADYLTPGWGLNRRGYRKFFGGSRFDWLKNLALEKLASPIEFTEVDYRATGEEDFGLAFRAWAEAKGLLSRRSWVVTVGGLWGGRWALRRAQPFLDGQLTATRYTSENLAETLEHLQDGLPTCVVHLRGGDFAKNDGDVDIQGRFNVALPYSWYVSALKSVKEAFGHQLNLVIVTNDQSDAARSLIEESGALTTLHQTNSDISDLLLLSKADIVIPSVSSFSILALFLNPNASYLWPHDQLTPVTGVEGTLGVWAHEQLQKNETSQSVLLAKEKAPCFGRAIAYRSGDVLPPEFIDPIRLSVNQRHRARDLIFYGSSIT